MLGKRSLSAGKRPPSCAQQDLPRATSLERYLRPLLCGQKRGIPVATILNDAPLGRIIDVDQTEALAVSLRPFEVIRQGPDEVTFHGHALRHYPLHCGNMLAQVLSA